MEQVLIKKNILINASTLVVGGGVQVGSSFINFLFSTRKIDSANFMICVSEQVFSNLDEYLKKDLRILIIKISPARLISGRSSRLKLLEIESSFKPDLIYSIGSPSYINFGTKEILRHTDPWVTHPSSYSYSVLPWYDFFYTKLLRQYKIFWIKKADYYETQTEVAKQGLIDFLGIDEQRITVIPNSYSPVFDNSFLGKEYSNKETFKVLTLSAPYWHKNLTLIPEVSALLRSKFPQKKYEFHVTLPDDNSPVVRKFWDLATKNRVEDSIKNKGVVSLAECPKLYEECDLLFLPTLLETFSATYLESMKMKVPIVTTDLDFARDICGEAAMYFKPKDAYSAMEAIYKISSIKENYEELQKLGSERLLFFPVPTDKYQKVLDHLMSLI